MFPKKFFCLLTFLILSFAGYSQNAAWSGPPPAPVSGSYVYNGPTSWTTENDTVTNTGTDTLKLKLDGVNSTNYNVVYDFQSLTFKVEILKISGTPTSCVATLYGDNGPYLGNGMTPITSYTVTASTSPQYVNYIQTGNPYTNYMWVFVGSGTQSCSWYGTLLER